MSDSPDRADLLTNAAALIDHFRAQRISTERQLDAVQIRLEIIDDVLARLTGSRRRRSTFRPTPSPFSVERALDSEAESDLPPAA
jgi:hypothetical protein